MHKGLVSVIIPTKNRASYVKQAVDSVYAQSYQHFEIIVIDDGSTDHTRDISKFYDKRLHYFFQGSKGVSAARNTGMAKAQGEYIAFLDDDDMFMPKKLQSNVEYLLHNRDMAWLCSGFSFIDASGRPLPRDAIVLAKPEITLHDIAMFTFIHTSSVMVRRDILDAAGGFPEGMTFSEDYHLWARILRCAKGGALQKTLTCFRQHGGNTKLPYRALVKENTRIIDWILATQSPDLLPRAAYIENLHRIIAQSLWHKNHYVQYAAFRLGEMFTTY